MESCFLGGVSFGGCQREFERRGCEKRIFTADGEVEEGNLLYTTIHLFLFSHPLCAFLLPRNDTDKKKKRKMYRGERGTIALY
jgi:hypothetical protein